MRTEKTISGAAALLLVLTLAPLRASEPVLTAPEACQELEAQARLMSQALRCEATASGLVLREVSASDLQTLREKLFPAQTYLGHAVVLDILQPSQAQARRQTAPLRVGLQDSPAMAQAAQANFDNSVSRSGLVDAVAGTWKDLKGVQRASLVLQGPPGSGGGEPQKPPRKGPPGSGTPPGQTPPGGSTPPSRPAPVWRSHFPPPAPNWWNTDFDHYDWWNSIPSGYDRPRTDRRDEDTFFYYSGWYRWRDVFVTNWGRTQDAAAISRTAANQDQVHTRSLTSQAYREAKECYYQAVYRYDWAQGGIYGSHWEERFDHYSARCLRLPREYGQPRVYTTHVSFDMNLVAGQDLPWESDVIRVTYDGQGAPGYDYSGAAYRYSARLDDRQAGSESVTLVAGAKVLRAPEADKVQAFLRVDAGKVELVINDDRTRYYEGETLRVNARVVRRVVIKVKGLLWGWNEKNVDTVIASSPLDIVVGASNPQSVTDLTGPASAPKPANAVRSSVFIESWEFTRVNSRISNASVIRRGKGNDVAY